MRDLSFYVLGILIGVFVLSGCASQDLRDRMNEYHNHDAYPGDTVEKRINDIECRINGDCNESGKDIEEVLDYPRY